MGNNIQKKPLYTVRVESKQTPLPNISGSGIQPKQSAGPQSKSIVQVENMTLEQLLNSYHKTEDEEPMLPGFNYLKKMKNSIKAERVKSVLKR